MVQTRGMYDTSKGRWMYHRRTLPKYGRYLLSASGGTISKFWTSIYFTFDPYTFMIKVDTIRDPPPPPATFLAFHPRDENIVTIGMSDSIILIYNFELHKFEKTLDGPSQRIIGLTFSLDLNVLVSSGADAKWVPCDTAALISHATFSCDSQLVYASFFDATVCVFNARNLLPGCRINASIYLSPNVSNSNVKLLVIAAHPIQRNQFVLGLSDGRVYVIEPLYFEDCSTSNVTTTPLVEALGLDQPRRRSNCCQSTSSFACFSCWPSPNLGQAPNT